MSFFVGLTISAALRKVLDRWKMLTHGTENQFPWHRLNGALFEGEGLFQGLWLAIITALLRNRCLKYALQKFWRRDRNLGVPNGTSEIGWNSFLRSLKPNIASIEGKSPVTDVAKSILSVCLRYSVHTGLKFSNVRAVHYEPLTNYRECVMLFLSNRNLFFRNSGLKARLYQV